MNTDIAPKTDNMNSLPDQISSGKTMMRTSSNFCTAITVQKPRILEEVIEKCKIEARFAGEAGTFLEWGWPQNQKQPDGKYAKVWIHGSTVEAAKIIMRNYTNCACEVDIKDMGDSWLYQAIFIDLESGTTTPGSWMQSKIDWKGEYASGREASKLFQMGYSKAIRKAIEVALPGWLFNTILLENKRAFFSRDNIEKARLNVLSIFKRLDFTKGQLVKIIGVPFDDWTFDIIGELWKIFMACEQGYITINEITNDLDKITVPKIKSKSGRPSLKANLDNRESNNKSQTKCDKGEIIESYDNETMESYDNETMEQQYKDTQNRFPEIVKQAEKELDIEPCSDKGYELVLKRVNKIIDEKSNNF